MPTLIFIRLYLKSFYQKTNFLTSYFYLHNPKHNLLDSSYSITNQIHVVYPSFFQFYHHFHIGMHIILLILVFHNFIFVYLLKYQIWLFINQSLQTMSYSNFDTINNCLSSTSFEISHDNVTCFDKFPDTYRISGILSTAFYFLYFIINYIYK